MSRGVSHNCFFAPHLALVTTSYSAFLSPFTSSNLQNVNEKQRTKVNHTKQKRNERIWGLLLLLYMYTQETRTERQGHGSTQVVSKNDSACITYTGCAWTTREKMLRRDMELRFWFFLQNVFVHRMIDWSDDFVRENIIYVRLCKLCEFFAEMIIKTALRANLILVSVLFFLIKV